MKKTISYSLLLFSLATFASETNGLKKADQKYYQNEPMTGMNDLQRIDSTVKEINKVYGELESMKAEIAELKKEIQNLKQRNK